MHVHPTALDPGPYLVLDLSRGLDPHQARCRRCRWRSGWRATAVQARAEHARHQRAAHGRPRRGGRAGRRRLMARWLQWGRCRTAGARLPGPAGASTLPHLARVGLRCQASRSWSW
jgi:hypothetical protein